MSAPEFTVAFRLQAAIRDRLTSWPALSGVDIATGPRTREVAERVAVGDPLPTSEYRGAYIAEEGAVALFADAFAQGAGEDAIDAARERAAELLAEAVAALSLYEQTGGDITLGGLVLAISASKPRVLDNYLDSRGGASGHALTLSVTCTYTARIPTGGS